jgi:hypothetical protein
MNEGASGGRSISLFIGMEALQALYSTALNTDNHKATVSFQRHRTVSAYGEHTFEHGR